jgi:cell division protein FtsW (lipid II flippase)
VVGLLVVSAMVSLPTAAQSGERITAFYEAHRQVIIVQQVAGALLLVPFLGFAVALDRRARAQSGGSTRWLPLAGLLFAAAEVATNLPPLALAAMPDPAPATAHTLTLIEDFADAALFVAIALFSLVAALAEPSWVRIVGLAVAALTLVRAVASPLGVTALDAAAPIAVLVFSLVLSVRLLVTDRARRSRAARSPKQ